jgi:accessory colonization factor AcfC
VVPFEAARNIVSDVKGSVLSFAQEPEVAQAFLDFLSSTNVAPVFVKYGYVLRGPEKAVQ